VGYTQSEKGESHVKLIFFSKDYDLKKIKKAKNTKNQLK